MYLLLLCAAILPRIYLLQVGEIKLLLPIILNLIHILLLLNIHQILMSKQEHIQEVINTRTSILKNVTKSF